MQKQLSWQAVLIWVTIYSVAMGFLECAVVVYLRTIYYPYGFEFPLAPIDKTIAITEIGREAATLFMLLAIGFIAGKTKPERFAYFILSFAIWDIFYYIFLYVLIGWPESLFTWDILFLIPVVWVGPVIAPVILSLTMIILGLIIILRQGRNRPVKIGVLAWIFLIAGSIIIILSFTWDYSSYLLDRFSFSEIISPKSTGALLDSTYSYSPGKFNWFIFIMGELVIIGGIILTMAKNRKL